MTCVISLPKECPITVAFEAADDLEKIRDLPNGWSEHRWCALASSTVSDHPPSGRQCREPGLTVAHRSQLDGRSHSPWMNTTGGAVHSRADLCGLVLGDRVLCRWRSSENSSSS
jgi:hypothetical protein